jgi:hypothetical protein
MTTKVKVKVKVERAGQTPALRACPRPAPTGAESMTRGLVPRSASLC